MPFALIIAGLILFIAGVRDKQDDLFTLIKGDFTGSGNFVYWILALLIVGSLGYIDKIKPAADAFIILILIVLFISKPGFFGEFTRQIATTTTVTPVNVVDNSSLVVTPTLPQLNIG